MKFFDALEQAKKKAVENVQQGTSPKIIRLFLDGDDSCIEVDDFGNVSFENEEDDGRRHVLFCIDDLNSDGWTI